MATPPFKVTYLLAVWGEKYIRQFMDLGLRTLLAPGNIPALSQQAKNTFTFLTHSRNRDTFIRHPLYPILEKHCTIEWVFIDDLIFDGNYSATLTLAYERGMRHAGEEMLSTYFIYLVADYMVADGSLANLLPYMQKNVSAITTGNFQVVEEDMLEIFQSRMNGDGIITIPPRELVALALPHIHPMTIANTVTQDELHTEHSNRLFWHVDENTLIGRFYLRHMICIKPEIDNYIIGAPCDYAFVEEMCPSGNVVHITDSDEYCVIELQPRAHEKKLIKLGPFQFGQLHKSLGEWTTAPHRRNVYSAVIFHAADISKQTGDCIQESERFVQSLEENLPAPKPVRGHPYWLSCIDGVLYYLATTPGKSHYFRNGIYAGLLGSPVFEPPLGKETDDYHLLKLRRKPFSSRKHHRLFTWAQTALFADQRVKHSILHREYARNRFINNAIEHIAARSNRFVFIGYKPMGHADWCREHFPKQAILKKYELFISHSPDELKTQLHGVDHVLILLSTTDIYTVDKVLDQCRHFLGGEKRITIILTQPFFPLRGKRFKERLAVLANHCQQISNIQVESIKTLNNPSRVWCDSLYHRGFDVMLRNDVSLRANFKRIIAIPMMGVATLGYIMGNLLCQRATYPNQGKVTCAIIQFRFT